MKYKKALIVLVVLLLCVFLFFILFKTPDYTLLTKEQKEKYRTIIDQKIILLEPFIKEKQNIFWDSPNFYTVKKEDNYEYLIFRYSNECDPYEIKSIKENRDSISITLVDDYVNLECLGEVYSNFEVIKFSNPKNKYYNIYIDNGKRGTKMIEPFEKIFNEYEKVMGKQTTNDNQFGSIEVYEDEINKMKNRKRTSKTNEKKMYKIKTPEEHTYFINKYGYSNFYRVLEEGQALSIYKEYLASERKVRKVNDADYYDLFKKEKSDGTTETYLILSLPSVEEEVSIYPKFDITTKVELKEETEGLTKDKIIVDGKRIMVIYCVEEPYIETIPFKDKEIKWLYHVLKPLENQS